MSAPWLASLALDPQVPARDAVLDPARVERRLPGVLGVPAIDACQLVRAKYRIGESVRGTYRLDVGGVEHIVYARSFRDGESRAQYERALSRAVPAGPIAPVAHEPDLGVVWWAFPNDRRMTGLSVFADPAASLNGEWRGWTSSDIVQVVPERSVTARAESRSGATVGFVKHYVENDDPVDRLATRLNLFADGLVAAGGSTRAPRAIASSDTHRLVMQEPMPGARWADVGVTVLPDVMRNLGEALALIHAFDLGPFVATGLRRFERLTPQRVLRCAELVATARPDVAHLAHGVAERLEGSVPGDLGPDCVLHGDVHPGNALIDQGNLAVIDTDQAGIGPAAADVASLIARVRFGAVSGQWDRATADHLVATFAAGYRSRGALPDPDVVRWLVAAALVAERALRAVNRVHVAGLAALGPTLDLAHQSLREAPW